MTSRVFAGARPVSSTVRLPDLAELLADPDVRVRREAEGLRRQLRSERAVGLLTVRGPDVPFLLIDPDVTLEQRGQLVGFAEEALLKPYRWLWVDGFGLFFELDSPGRVQPRQPEFGPHPDPDRLREAYAGVGCQVVDSSDVDDLALLASVSAMGEWAAFILDLPTRQPTVVLRAGLSADVAAVAEQDAMHALTLPERFGVWWRGQVLIFSPSGQFTGRTAA